MAFRQSTDSVLSSNVFSACRRDGTFAAFGGSRVEKPCRVKYTIIFSANARTTSLFVFCCVFLSPRHMPPYVCKKRNSELTCVCVRFLFLLSCHCVTKPWCSLAVKKLFEHFVRCRPLNVLSVSINRVPKSAQIPFDSFSIVSSCSQLSTSKSHEVHVLQIN